MSGDAWLALLVTEQLAPVVVVLGVAVLLVAGVTWAPSRGLDRHHGAHRADHQQRRRGADVPIAVTTASGAGLDPARSPAR